VEDTWHIVIRFKSGMYTTWSYSRVFPGVGGKAGTYYGSKGSMEDCGFSFHCFEGGGKLKGEDGSEKSASEIQEEFLASLSEEQKEHLFPYGLTGGFQVEVYDFVRAVGTGTPVEMDGEAGLRAKALCEACYESATAGQPVKYQDVLDGKISAYQDPINEYWKI
jgi:predicted dehydrogenase